MGFQSSERDIEQVSSRTCGVYLLHLAEPLYGSTCKHYIGSSSDIATRVLRHASGRGARFTRAAVRQRIPFDVVRIWPTPSLRDARRVEQALKRRHHHDTYCPICVSRRTLGLPR